MILQDPAFAALVAQHRRALHVHCYRMLGSYTDADDLVQETMLRAWTARASYDSGTGEAGMHGVSEKRGGRGRVCAVDMWW